MGIHSYLTLTNNIQLFRERLSGKVHATILNGIVGGFEFSFCQKESNKSKFDSYRRQEQCIDHILLPLGIVACTFFPTTILEIVVYRS